MMAKANSAMGFASHGIGPAHDVGGSFRDPAGHLFWRGGELYRQINACHAADYELLMSGGLYRELIEAGLLVPHSEVAGIKVNASAGPRAYKTIRPRRLGFVSYPYEWCFSQFKDSALATLKVQRAALRRGLWLKDASAYNIQLLDGRPALIDTLSLERYPEGRPWAAYGQFCRHFLAPLALMARVDERLGQLLRVHLDGVPLDLASRLLPWRTRLSPGLGMHLHLHARMVAKHARRRADHSLVRPSGREDGVRQPTTGGLKSALRSRHFPRKSLLLLLDSLERLVLRLEYRPGRSTWGDYYGGMHNYEPAALEAKEQIVVAALEELRPQTVWDLGANDGRFSRIASGHGVRTVSCDLEHACVERNYRAIRAADERNLWPLLLDLTNPSPAQGWAHEERMSFAERGPADVVLALGLVHHLTMGNNVPWERLAKFFAQLGRSLVVEFVPRADSQVQRLLSSRTGGFDDYEVAPFEQAFRRHFNWVLPRPIPGSLRTIYVMRRRGAFAPAHAWQDNSTEVHEEEPLFAETLDVEHSQA